MEAVLFGIATAHEPGAFCKRVISEHYFFACFHTPFLYERDGVLLQGEPGDLLMVPPGLPVYHGGTPESDTGFVNDWIYLSGSELPAMLRECPLPQATAFPSGSSGVLRRYLEAVRQECAQRLPGYRAQIGCLTGQLIVQLHRLRPEQDPADPARDRIARVREALLAAPEKDWTLDEMARASGYSQSRFSALYKSRFGCSPKQELLRSRVELAARLLRYTGCTVGDAARSAGFHSLYYFSRYFKEVTGLCPSEYARQDTP